MEVETHGNDPVPLESRRQGWFAFFTLYSGVNICLPMMLVGGAFVPGLSLPQAVLAGLLGNGLAFAISSVAAYPGADHGLPTPVLTRASLGYPWGTWLPSLAILVSSIGWFAVHTELAAMALQGVLRTLTGQSAPLIVFIVIMGAANAFVAIIGFNWIQKLAAVAVPLLLVLSVLLLFRIASNHSLPDILSRPGLGPLSFLGAVNIVLSSQMGSAFTAADFARYSRDHRSVWIGSLSVAPVAAFMMALGAISALATGEANPILGVQSLGLGVGALVVIGLATWTTSDKVLYSGGLALTNVFPKWPRWLNTLLLGAVGTAIASLRLTQHFTQWLILLGTIFAPLVGLLIADHFVFRRRRLEGMEGSAVNWVAIVALACGIVAGRLAPPETIQPVTSIVVTAGVYVAGMRGRKRSGLRTTP